MIQQLAIEQRDVAEAVIHLQQLSYRIEAEFIGFADLPPLKETAADLQTSAEDFCGYVVGDQLCGVISVARTADVIEICRLCVHPDWFRKGIAEQLLEYVEQGYGYEEMRVATGTDNHPAVRFYQKNGFSQSTQRQTPEGLNVTLFYKKKVK